MSKIKYLSTAALALSSLVSCAAPIDDGEVCADGRCDDRPDSEIPDSPCDGEMIDKSGRGNKKVAGRLSDPIANLVFRTGDSCPKTFQDIMAKLRETDKEGCPNEKDGISTRLVSETAQGGGDQSYRAVVTRRCGNRQADGIVFSLFGLRSNMASLPAAVEMIGFDETNGVFNYYETDGREINFFGSSKDMLQGAGQGGDRRCAQCHDSGGLVMKELDTPWLHWEGHMDTPGAREFVEKHSKDLGSKNSGAELEGLVKNANTKWNKTRIEFLKTDPDNAAQAVLKPLFCSTEVNLDNGADFESPVAGGTGGSQISGINFDSILDPNLKGFGSLPITFADYDAQIKANGQRVAGIAAGAVDTVFDYVYIERAHSDNNYVQQLKTLGIIDDDLMKDVLMVDFTRPVFSNDRCGLLAFVPKMAAEDLTAAKIREALTAALEAETPAATSPAGVLLANLKATGDDAAHTAKIDAFTNACKALGSKPLVENALKITSLNRNIARGLHVFEFESTMPTDNLNVNPEARLDPKTCQISNSFVAP